MSHRGSNVIYKSQDSTGFQNGHATCTVVFHLAQIIPPQPSQLRQSAIQHPRRGFTTKDISNTVKVRHLMIYLYKCYRSLYQHCTHHRKASKSSSSRKRKIEALNIPEDSLKRKQKKTSTHVDIDLLRGKIENVMGRIGEMETLLNDINSTLEDILYTVA